MRTAKMLPGKLMLPVFSLMAVAFGRRAGAVLALAFCPTSAALFFGSLVPMSIERESAFLLPLVFGIGTSLPVVAFALLIALGVSKLNNVFNHLSVVERYFRMITGVVFLAVGIVLSIRIIASQVY